MVVLVSAGCGDDGPVPIDGAAHGADGAIIVPRDGSTVIDGATRDGRPPGDAQVIVVAPSRTDWPQDAHDAQRSGYSPIEPEEPWTFAWTFNGSGPTAGSTSGHLYQQPALNEPWEARTVTGDGRIYIPAGSAGLYARDLASGSEVWHFDGGTFGTTPAYDPSTRALFAGSHGGTLYKLDVATGAVIGTYEAGAPIDKAVLVAGEAVYVVGSDGTLHRVHSGSMSREWTYEAASPAQTPASYSASQGIVVYCTADLFVHAVNDGDGSGRWRVKPTPRTPGFPHEFTGGWPVIAEQHGLVFVRVNQGIDLIFSPGDWPAANAARRAKLEAAPAWKNLFALDLGDGGERFVPAVGPQGVEDLLPGPDLRVHSFPVIKVLPSGREIAYQTFRGPPREAGWDARWDSHVGEMMLDGDTVAGYAAGDLRHIEFTSAFSHITDENCPLTMAGDTLFFSHWAATGAHQITDRAASFGDSSSNPLPTHRRPPMARAQTCDDGSFNPATHHSDRGMNYDHETAGCTGRWIDGPGFYSYYGTIDPPTRLRGAYSEGSLPRYTYVSGPYIVFEGNGGDLVVLRHSGTVPVD